MLTRRVLVIGLDGATWNILDDLVKHGSLPNLAKLVREGVAGSLESTIPPLTFPAWVSFATGKNPGKLGIYSFVEDFDTMIDFNIISATMIKAKRIWNFLDEHGIKSCIVNLPATYPPNQVNGVMVSGAFVPAKSRDYAYPPELVRKLEEMGYQVRGEGAGLFARSPQTPEEKRKAYEVECRNDDVLARVVRMLARQVDWDFFFVLFDGIDHVQHLFWDDRSILSDYFSRMDRIVGEIVDLCSKEGKKPLNVLIISDHGFHSFPQVRFALSAWLKSTGFAQRKKDDKYQFLLLRVGKIAQKLLKKIGVDLVATHTLRRLLMKSYNEYWADQPVKPSFFGLFINGKIVPDDGRGRVVDDLVGRLNSVRHDSEKVMQAVLRREEIYSGEYLERAPDVVFLTNPRYFADPLYPGQDVYSPMEGWPAAPHITGHHTSAREGILIAWGSDIKVGGSLTGARIFDVAPTILHMLSVPIPDDIDGRVMREIFVEGSDFARHPVEIVHPSDQTAREKERVRMLIYELKKRQRV